MKPILFNTEMVRAILDGRKTVTRRPVKFGRGRNPKWSGYVPDGGVLYGSNNIPAAKAPYQAGDILWVRETWRIQSAHRFEADAKIEYKAGGPMGKVKFKCRSDYDCFIWNQPVGEGKWKPSIHMPREAARIFLRVTGVRVERLRDITEEQAKKEGAPAGFEYNTPDGPVITLDEDGYFSVGFKAVWDNTIKPSDRALYSWAANPWVWVIEFERISKEEAEQ